jgi:hypothetical protein
MHLTVKMGYGRLYAVYHLIKLLGLTGILADFTRVAAQ